MLLIATVVDGANEKPPTLLRGRIGCMFKTVEVEVMVHPKKRQ